MYDIQVNKKLFMRVKDSWMSIEELKAWKKHGNSITYYISAFVFMESRRHYIRARLHKVIKYYPLFMCIFFNNLVKNEKLFEIGDYLFSILHRFDTILNIFSLKIT